MKSIIALTALCVLSALTLAGVNELTREVIADNRTAAAAERLRGLVPTTNEESLCLMGIVLATTKVRGYGGPMTVYAAISDGRLLGVRVPHHSETPGFSEILEPQNWISRFAVQAPPEVDAVSGATITSVAVKRALAELLADEQYALLADKCPGEPP